MPDFHNTGSNSGIIVGGNVSDSNLTVQASGQAASSADERAALAQVSDLLTDLLAGLGQLPREQVKAAADGARDLQDEVEKPHRDHGKIKAALDKLSVAVAAATPLIEIVNSISEIVTKTLQH
ncbi:MAG TPA: hypothetical protein VGG75_11570 [Trebonia sp.]|jgi:hypothetical protein